MYLSFYELKIKPFQNSTNPSFFWFGEKQHEALAIFKYGISKIPGILLLTGDVGTGKTILINVLLNNLDDQFLVVKVLDPGLEKIDFFNYIADVLNFKKKFSSKDTFLAHFHNFLDTSSTLGKKVVLVIDECQRLTSQLLDEIVELANIEKEETKLLKVVLIGQNSFNDLLQKDNSKELHQSIAINYAIAPLDLKETGRYVRHRLKIAGAKSTIFSPDAFTKIYEFSTGIPRRINIICDHALLLGFAQEMKTINGELIRECAMDLRPQYNSQSPQNDFPEPAAVVSSTKRRRSSPESQPKAASHRARTFTMIVLILIPVFLATYFTASETYLKVLHYIKNTSRQFFINPHAADIQEQNPSSSPDIKVSKDNAAPHDITPIPETTEIKEHQPDTPSATTVSNKSVPPEEKLYQHDIAADSPPKIADSPSQTEDFAPVVSVDPIKKDVTLENVAPLPAMTFAEKEVPTEPDTFAVPVAKENRIEEKDVLNMQNESQVDLTIAKETSPKTQDPLPDMLDKPDTPLKNQEVVDSPPPNPIDPGAVIDWVLKNRSK